MKVAIRTPDSQSYAKLTQLLAGMRRIDLTDADDPRCDITLIHARLMPSIESGHPSHAHRSQAIVVFAPNDPLRLALYLASGVRGYLRAAEPLSRLVDVLSLVANGKVRAEPLAMNELLRIYRRLVREFQRRNANGRVH
jgi:DNA-binding NarL/FixJ family response regulator